MYVWINPVTELMYEKEELQAFLNKHRLVWIRHEKDWGSIVKEKYQQLLNDSQEIIIDNRCPMASDIIKELINTNEELGQQIKIADIDPILIHCAKEVSENKKWIKEQKLIITPCKRLAEVGNELKLAKTTFISWNDLLKKLKDRPHGKKLKKSPIPLGFFQFPNVRIASISDEAVIKSYFQQEKFINVDLIEMLYCKDGCHNGDGVIEDE